MIRISIFALVVMTAAAAAFAAPAAAQSRTPVSAHNARVAAHQQSARRLYNMVPQQSAPAFSDDPSSTGGGSVGYNQMIYNW